MGALEYLKKQISRMSSEAQTLADKRMNLDQQIQEVNMRLTHLTGAIKEVSLMLKELEMPARDIKTND